MKILELLVEMVRVVHRLAGKVARHDRDLAQQMKRASKAIPSIIESRLRLRLPHWLMITHVDAIAFLKAAGVSASRRNWDLGDTVVVPLGHPSTHKGITIHPAVAWLVPIEGSWTVRQPIGQLNRELSFSTLRDACDAVLVIARAFAIFRDCDGCNCPAQLDFGERSGSPQFWIALRCLHCGAQVESDDTGSLPDDLRALELTRNGTWSVSVARPTEPAQWTVLRRELQLGLPELAQLKASLPVPSSPARSPRPCGYAVRWARSSLWICGKRGRALGRSRKRA